MYYEPQKHTFKKFFIFIIIAITLAVFLVVAIPLFNRYRDKEVPFSDNSNNVISPDKQRRQQAIKDEMNKAQKNLDSFSVGLSSNDINNQMDYASSQLNNSSQSLSPEQVRDQMDDLSKKLK